MDSEVFRVLTGRDPTNEQLTRIRIIASTLSTGENDAFLTIITALDAYYDAISDIPRRIEEAGKMAAASAEAVATSAAAQAASIAREHIERAVDIKRFARDWRMSVITTMGAMACIVFGLCIGVFLMMDRHDAEIRSGLETLVASIPKQIETVSISGLKEAARLAADDVFARMNAALSETVTDRVDKTMGFIKSQLSSIHILVLLEEQSPGILSILSSKEGVQVARLLKTNGMNACPLMRRTSDGVTTCTFVSP